MAFATKQRMKVLPSVTVRGLEAALEKGFSQVGHRCLTPFIPLLSKMTWKTAASSHLDAFVALEAILFFLLLECANGLIPDMLLAKAFESLHKKPNAGFSYSGPLNFEAISVFFLLKLRQLAGKIRSLGLRKVFGSKRLAKPMLVAMRAYFVCVGCCSLTSWQTQRHPSGNPEQLLDVSARVRSLQKIELWYPMNLTQPQVQLRR